MNKFVMVTDTHAGVHNNSDYWLNINKLLFDEIIDYCIKENINDIIHLGDLFDSRKSLNVKTLNKVVDIVKKISENKINLYLILGNHDIFYNNSLYPNSLASFKNIPYVNIIDKPYYYNKDIILSPWQTIPDIPSKYLLSHLEINGFPMNTSGSEFSGGRISISDLSDFEQVYSGHFHTYSTKENITYIGSPYAMSFNDILQNKGYYIFDGGDIQFIEFTDAPKFISITTNDELNQEDIEGNIIRFTFLEDYGTVKNDKLIEKIYSMGPVKVQLDYRIEEDDSDLIQSEEEEFTISDNSVIFREYIDQKNLPSNIKKDILKKFVDKLEQE